MNIDTNVEQAFILTKENVAHAWFGKYLSFRLPIFILMLVTRYFTTPLIFSPIMNGDSLMVCHEKLVPIIAFHEFSAVYYFPDFFFLTENNSIRRLTCYLCCITSKYFNTQVHTTEEMKAFSLEAMENSCHIRTGILENRMTCGMRIVHIY